MRLRAVMLGAAVGLVVGVLVAVLRHPVVRPAAPPVPLGEDGGRITRIAMHYQPDAASLAVPIYRQFLRAVGPDVYVTWAVAATRDLDDLRARLGDTWPAHTRGVIIGKPITTWAKDRFVALRQPETGGAVCGAPRRTRAVNPLRTNDQEVPYRLAQSPDGAFGVRGCDAGFDGGDFLATADHLFVGPTVLQTNRLGPGARFETRDALAAHLAERLGRPVTWLGDTPADAPPHHVGMFLTVIGRTAAVGEVVERLTPETRRALARAGGPAAATVRADLSVRLDKVARRLRGLGYTVVRVPLVPSATTRAWMSYNNGIVETRGGRPVFYMPTFGAPALDAAAAARFRAVFGATVVPIDCAGIWHLGGSLHCLVNVVGRGA
jgi:hypothetical protein